MRFCLSCKIFIFLNLIILCGIEGNILAENMPQKVRTGGVLSWDNITEAYDTYVDCPSPDNAKALLAALPADQPYEMHGVMAIEHIFSVDSYPILYQEAISGERTAIEVYFRLLNVTDGHYTEIVWSTLGFLVRDRPRLFLEILQSYKDTQVMKTNRFPVSFVGVGYNVHPKAAIYILKKRMEALETVKDPRYAEIKEVCYKILKEAIEWRAQLIGQ